MDNIAQTTGKCQEMCPAAEIQMRIRENLVHPLEKVNKSGKWVCDPDLMVKSYSRSAAGRHEIPTHDLRPGPVLCSTVEYLLGRVSTSTGVPWVEVYDFIFDRLRAVRQDLTIQQIDGQEAVTVLEYAVRFYIYAGYRLCEESFDHFDPKINGQHTQECLKQLLSIYPNCGSHCVHRAEFESLYLIYNLGQTEALHHFYELPSDVRKNDLVEMAYTASVAFHLRNYLRVLKCFTSDLFTKQPLLLCAFHSNLTQLQLNALRVMAHGFSSKVLRYPVQHLSDMLWFDGLSKCLSFCEACSIHVLEQEWVTFLKTSFREPEKLKPVHIAGIDLLLCKRPLSELLLQKKLQPSESTVIKTSATELCKLDQTQGCGTGKTQFGRGRGRGRGRKDQEVNHTQTLFHRSRTGQEFNSLSGQGHQYDNRMNICEMKKESESERKNYKGVSSECTEKVPFNINRREQGVPFQSESWEDELFTEQDMKVISS